MTLASMRKRGSVVTAVHSQSFVFLCGIVYGAVIVISFNWYNRSSVPIDPSMLVNDQISTTTKMEASSRWPIEKIVLTTTTTEVTTTIETTMMTTTRGQQDDRLATLDKVRILCFVLTQPANNATKAKAVKDTWGRRCSKLLFVSSVEDKELGAIAPPHAQEGRIWIWAKTKGALEYIWKNFRNDFDWFLKADDDTYVVMEAMRYFLSNHSSSEPLYIGSKYYGDPYNKDGYMYGGSGYILSHRTLERFIKEAVPNGTICEPAVTKVRPHYRGDEDVELARCLRNIGGIKAIIPKDNKGRWRFLQNSFGSHAERNDLPESEGPECCRDTAITFHYMEPKQQYMMEYLLYHFKLPTTLAGISA